MSSSATSLPNCLNGYNRTRPPPFHHQRMHSPDHLNQPISSVARKDLVCLHMAATVGESLATIRQKGAGEKIVYFYVIDDNQKLVGVLPTRALLTAPLDKHLAEVMIKRVATIPESATILEACEAFIMHKFLAFPVVDHERRIVGVVDVGLLAEEAFDIAQREQTDALFESIGFRVSQVRDASPFRAFRFRFPWLLATIASGTICAMLAGAFEMTLASSIVLAFFLTLVLGLGESVSIQSMTVAIQALRVTQPTVRWYIKELKREMGTAALLAVTCGCTVGMIAWLWRGEALAALVIGSGISMSICMACFFGLSVPALLHALKLDPKIASGPVTLALADIFTILFYFSLAAIFL